MAGVALRLHRVIRTTAPAAYAAFSDPALLEHWFTTSAQATLVVGGAYSNADGDRGRFLVLDPPHRLEFTWENAHHCPGTVVSVGFAHRADGRVDATLEHSRLASARDLADMLGGWSWALDSLASYLETGRPIAHEEWLKVQGPDSAPLELRVEVAVGGGGVGHIPALPGFSFRGDAPTAFVTEAPHHLAAYAEWLVSEGLSDIHPSASMLVRLHEQGRLEAVRIAEVEQRIGAPSWISGHPSTLFDSDRRPMVDSEIRGHLRFVERATARMRSLVAGLPPGARQRKPAPNRRSLDETLAHIGNCIWWYCSRIDDALPEPPTIDGEDPMARTERFLADAAAYLPAVPLAARGELHVPRRFQTLDLEEPWTHTKACRRMAEHAWEHLHGLTRDAERAAAG